VVVVVAAAAAAAAVVVVAIVAAAAVVVVVARLVPGLLATISPTLATNAAPGLFAHLRSP
jgi:hypothetical protein